MDHYVHHLCSRRSGPDGIKYRPPGTGRHYSILQLNCHGCELERVALHAEHVHIPAVVEFFLGNAWSTNHISVKLRSLHPLQRSWSRVGQHRHVPGHEIAIRRGRSQRASCRCWDYS